MPKTYRTWTLLLAASSLHFGIDAARINKAAQVKLHTQNLQREAPCQPHVNECGGARQSLSEAEDLGNSTVRAKLFGPKSWYDNTGGQCSTANYAYCCNVGRPCMCERSQRDNNCGWASYQYCCLKLAGGALSKPCVCPTGEHEPAIIGKVKILSPGRNKGKHGIVDHYDFKSSRHCVIELKDVPSSLGCYRREHLQLVDRNQGYGISADQEYLLCPAITATIAAGLGSDAATIKGLLYVLLGSVKVSPMRNDYADSYVIAFYISVLHLTVALYSTRDANSVKVPKLIGKAPGIVVGSIEAPTEDIDDISGEFSFLSDMFGGVVPPFTCLQTAIAKQPFEDVLDSQTDNQWHTAMRRSGNMRKKDWILHFFEQTKTKDGKNAWPVEEINYNDKFLRQDEWSDGLESAIAFERIGAHRVEVVQKRYSGENLPFALKLNAFGELPVRKHFGKYGGDMYFTAEGLPALIVTPDGKHIARGNRDWQYWKFVWRSSLITVITLVDHLHFTHFRMANVLAKAARRTLKPDHPMRRLMTIFTFGSIKVNSNAIHALVDADHTLHRASPFASFAEEISHAVPDLLPCPVEDDEIGTGMGFLSLSSETHFRRLPPKLQATPYFADGKLLFKALHDYIYGYFDMFYSDWCDSQDGLKENTEFAAFVHEVAAINRESRYKGMDDEDRTCKEVKAHMVAFVWAVTGWHRHVGTVGDYYADPELASFSWKDGEAVGRPKQHIIAASLSVFTGMQQPKLNEDYSHVFEGMEKEAKAKQLFAKFKQDLDQVQRTVQQRNAARAIPNNHADPGIVECSVAV